MRSSTYWTAKELTGALVCAVGGLLVLGLMWRLGLYFLAPFVLVAFALGWAWAARG